MRMEPTLGADRLRRVGDEIGQHLVELPAIGPDFRVAVELGVDRDGRGDADTQQRQRLLDQCRHRNRFPRDLLLAAEGQDLIHQVAGPLARAMNQLHMLVKRIVRRHFLHRQLRQAQDRHQRVVEIVRDAAGQSADRFHLLQLMDFLLCVAAAAFGRPLVRDVGADPDRATGRILGIEQNAAAQLQEPLDSVVGAHDAELIDAGVARAVAAGPALKAGHKARAIVGVDNARQAAQLRLEGLVHAQNFLEAPRPVHRSGREVDVVGSEIGGFDRDPVAGLRGTQFFFLAMLRQRQPHQAGARLQQAEIAVRRLPRFAVIHRDGAEHDAVMTDDWLRPAGAEAERQRELARPFPQRIGGDVADDDGRLAVGGGAARTDRRADLEVVDGGVVGIGKTRARTMAQMPAVRLQQQHRAQRRRRQPLDHVRDLGERVFQRGAGRHEIDNLAALVEERLPWQTTWRPLRPAAGHRALPLGPSPFCRRNRHRRGSLREKCFSSSPHFRSRAVKIPLTLSGIGGEPVMVAATPKSKRFR